MHGGMRIQLKKVSKEIYTFHLIQVSKTKKEYSYTI